MGDDEVSSQYSRANRRDSAPEKSPQVFLRMRQPLRRNEKPLQVIPLHSTGIEGFLYQNIKIDEALRALIECLIIFFSIFKRILLILPIMEI